MEEAQLSWCLIASSKRVAREARPQVSLQTEVPPHDCLRRVIIGTARRHTRTASGARVVAVSSGMVVLRAVTCKHQAPDACGC
jgi:hypothetical protein